MGESFQRGLQMENEITKYAEYLFALALKKCGDVNDAEDLTQETLLATFQYCHLGMRRQVVHQHPPQSRVPKSFGHLRRKRTVDRSGIRGVVKSVCRAKKTKKNPQKQTFLRIFWCGQEDLNLHEIAFTRT